MWIMIYPDDQDIPFHRLLRHPKAQARWLRIELAGDAISTMRHTLCSTCYCIRHPIHTATPVVLVRVCAFNTGEEL